jgi:uncharacterized protein (TIGR00369 family)
VAASVVPLTLRQPPRGGVWGPETLTMSGLDMLRANISGRLPDAPISRLTGLRLSEVGHGMASAAMPASLWWQTGAGVFFSGTVAFVADLPLGCAVLTIAPPGVGVASSELSVSFLRAATIRSQTLIGRARLIHGTRSLGLAEATIEDGRGRLLGHATSRCVLFPIDPEVASARQAGDGLTSSSPDPYLADIEGEVYGQEYWDATPGIEAVRGTVTGAFLPPAFRLMGLRGVEVSDGQVSMAMATSGWLSNPRGVIYGGAIAWLADATMSLATLTTIPAATAFGPLDLKIHFLRPVIPGRGELSARAKVVHRGRTIAVTHCDIFDAQAKLAAQATASQLILPGRPWDRPLHVADEFTDDAGRVLVTVLFIDMVDSSRHADRLGDRKWRALLADYHTAVREQLQRFQGSEIDNAGDGFLVSFDGAGRAVRCAAAIRESARGLGLALRAGLHAGECEQSGGKLVGIAVHIGARLAALAAPGEILVSRTVKDLVSGSGITFDDRGGHTLKGIADEWRVYAARI